MTQHSPTGRRALGETVPEHWQKRTSDLAGKTCSYTLEALCSTWCFQILVWIDITLLSMMHFTQKKCQYEGQLSQSQGHKSNKIAGQHSPGLIRPPSWFPRLMALLPTNLRTRHSGHPPRHSQRPRRPTTWSPRPGSAGPLLGHLRA